MCPIERKMKLEDLAAAEFRRAEQFEREAIKASALASDFLARRAYQCRLNALRLRDQAEGIK